MKIKFSLRTDVGVARKGLENEDAGTTTLYRDALEGKMKTVAGKGDLCVVCDGMGGEEAGEFASRIAMQTTVLHFNQLDKAPEKHQIKDLMFSWILTAHQAILSDAKSNPSRNGMGSTITIVWFLEDYIHIAWVGDSRVYLARNHQQSFPVTSDHSWVWDNIIGKEYSREKNEEARNHPESNIILQSLGGYEKPRPSYNSFALANDDRILICSDGLNSMLSDDEIGYILENRSIEPEMLTMQLINAANAAGGRDNITVFVGDIFEIQNENTSHAYPTGNIGKSLKLPFVVGGVVLLLLCTVAAFYWYSENEKKEKAMKEKAAQEKRAADSLRKVNEQKERELEEAEKKKKDAAAVAQIGDKVQSDKINQQSVSSNKVSKAERQKIDGLVDTWNELVNKKYQFSQQHKERLNSKAKDKISEFETAFKNCIFLGWKPKGNDAGFEKPKEDKEYKHYLGKIDEVKENLENAKKALKEADEEQKKSRAITPTGGNKNGSK
jgi:protein phosphatase